MALSQDEIYTKVKDVLVDALGVDEDDVTPTASLRADLGAESIDFLDITFRLEKAFTTDAGITEVARRLPHADLAQLRQTRDVALVPNLFAVQDIVDYLQRKFG
jgi:acyl carrier protein